jgi:hypothetical protein
LWTSTVSQRDLRRKTLPDQARAVFIFHFPPSLDSTHPQAVAGTNSPPMTDEPPEPQIDHATINLSRFLDRMYWRKRLATTDEALAEAVRSVGPLVKDVKQYLKSGKTAPQESQV